MRNSIPDPELLKQMRHISNVKLTIDSKFTSQGQLLFIDPQEDMASSWRNTVTALILLCLVVQGNCEVDHFSFQVVEKGTLVNEKIEVDVENQEEIIRVPKHNDLDEVQILNDFNKGLSVHRVPSTKDCFVYELDPSFPSPAKMILDMEEVSNQPIPNKVTTKTVRTRVLGLANRLALPRRVVDFCGTFPIYNAVKVPLDSMNTTLYKIQDGGRQRRDFEVRTLKYCSTQDGQALEDCINKPLIKDTPGPESVTQFIGAILRLSKSSLKDNSSERRALICLHLDLYLLRKMKGIFQSVIYIFGAALIVTCMPSQNDQDICNIKPERRYECGWFGIDQGTCEKKGCCWDSTHPDALFCYNSKRGPPPTCDVQSQNRYECGWLGIDEQTCLRRGCCWDESDPNAKYCYVKGHTNLPDGLCPVAPSERVECGYYGITKEECLNRACCWDETVTMPGARWCFKQPIDNPPFGCYIYHGIGGICKYVCDQNERKIYGLSQCKGRICCVK